MLFSFRSFLFALLSLFATIQTFACVCDGQASVKEALQHADIVFTGIVLSKTVTAELEQFGVRIKGEIDSGSFKATLKETPSAVVRIKVERAYKGMPTSDTIVIITAMNNSSCGVSFEIGQRWIVYGTIKD